MKCAVVGAGAWGTALADVLARNGHDVTLWAREQEVADQINAVHENTQFLGGHPLSVSLSASANLRDALAGAQMVVLATPSQHLRTAVSASGDAFEAGAIITLASKGIERDTLVLMSEVVEDVLPDHSIVALSGPSFAAEVVSGQPTAIVAASHDIVAAERIQELFSNKHLRVYTHDDVVGVELGGALKNVMAVGTGIVEGVGLGFNSRAALITRGLAEMTRLGVALGAQAGTFAGLAGVGDLVLTCTGALSRNRALGLEVGRGSTLAAALKGKQTVAEGVETTRSAHALAGRIGIEMPIVAMVHRILFDGYSAPDAVTDLMSRELRSEQDA